jgi:chromosome segregation ATPase
LGEQRDTRIRKLEESLSLAQSQGENSAVAAKRAGLDELAAAQKSWALERSQIESEHSARVTRLETELSAARLECDKKGSSIVQLSGECRELKMRCESLESSEKASLADLAIARKRHLEADSSLHDALLRNHEMEVAIGRLESANQEKDVVTKQQVQLVEAAKAQAQQSLHESESLRISNTKLEEKLRTATSEITKGNHIIEQLQVRSFLS